VNLSLDRSDGVPAPDGKAVLSLVEIAAGLAPPDVTVGLVLVDDERIQAINREFRGKDRPTDVISFSYFGDDDPSPEPGLAGEIYISCETLEKEAKQLGVDPGQLFLRIGVHGLMHVLGYDHIDDEDARLMESREREVLEGHLETAVLEKLF
jgi:probable rRNA maturation factor